MAAKLGQSRRFTVKKTITLATVVIAAFLTGCAGVQQLNDPALSKNDLDVANLLAPRQIPYETKSVDGVSVSHNLFYAASGNMDGYRATLIIRNDTDQTITFKPDLLFKDASGFIIQPYSYGGFVQFAAALAGTYVPPISNSTNNSYYSSGTITSNTGERYNYAGTTTQNSGGFAGGFASGWAKGMAQKAANDQEEGRVMLQWANSFWLKDSYTLPPKSAVSGALFYPAPKLGQLPIQFTVSLGSRKYEFLTVSAAKK